ncbi:MAG: hypothetical protein KH967_24765, partial [Klebsiella aerogenes]|nr:hypothetical protein [Klebsiella aerogenes]
TLPGCACAYRGYQRIPDRRSDKRSAIRQNNGAVVELSPVALTLTGATTRIPDRRSDKRSAIRQNNGAVIERSPVALTLTGATN